MIEWHGTDRLTLGNRIAAARIKAGIRQAELTKRAGMKPSLLGEIERGLAPCSIGQLARIAEGVGLPTSALKEGPQI